MYDANKIGEIWALTVLFALKENRFDQVYEKSSKLHKK